MRVGSLFAGIGGFDLAAERVGWEVAWQSEIDPYACKVLAKNFPLVPNLGDITTLDGTTAPPVDLLCGGFPCQDISLAGKGAGITGSRSGLWTHYARLIDETAPRWAVIENVSALRSRGLDVVLGALDALGYDAEWHCLPAASVGAPHRRDRIWVVAHRRDAAHALSNELREQPGRSRGSSWQGASVAGDDGQARHVADTTSERRGEAWELRHNESPQRVAGSSAVVAHAASEPQSEPRHETQAECDSGNARLEFGGSSYRRILPHAARELANANRGRQQERAQLDSHTAQDSADRYSPGRHTGGCGNEVADTSSSRLQGAEQASLLGARRWDEGRATAERSGGSLNPNFVEWLMGYPRDWTATADG